MTKQKTEKIIKKKKKKMTEISAKINKMKIPPSQSNLKNIAHHYCEVSWSVNPTPSVDEVLHYKF